MEIGDRILVKKVHNPINGKTYTNKKGEISYVLKLTFEVKFDESIDGYGEDKKFLYVEQKIVFK